MTAEKLLALARQQLEAARLPTDDTHVARWLAVQFSDYLMRTDRELKNARRGDCPGFRRAGLAKPLVDGKDRTQLPRASRKDVDE